ncbi:hypothetical protein EC973_007168 [Apophysomyces ossiformis]|uniref:Luc7-like protein n=1 Tax=Apophysomyces ossiformis TaxID=679940 RepID=A0A8H7EU27_9FUNG|nr:hypothetical protein EC973_007168 [Apophysomyces ossiformis]
MLELEKCKNLHSEELRNQYRKELQTDARKSLDPEHLRSLERIVGERNREVARAKEKLESVFPVEDTTTRKMGQQYVELNEKLMKKMNEAEKLVKSIDKLIEMKVLNKVYEKEKRYVRRTEKLQKTLDNTMSSHQPELRVCDICGVYIYNQDSNERIHMHNNSPKTIQIHTAFEKLRNRLKELYERQRSRRQERPREGKDTDRRSEKRVADRLQLERHSGSQTRLRSPISK